MHWHHEQHSVTITVINVRCVTISELDQDTVKVLYMNPLCYNAAPHVYSQKCKCVVV